MDYSILSTIIFIVGICGLFVVRKSVIIMLMSLELILLSVNIGLISFSVYFDDILGQFFALIILTVAAAESAIGLAILVIFYRLRGVITVDFINYLKG